MRLLRIHTEGLFFKDDVNTDFLQRKGERRNAFKQLLYKK